MGLKQTVKNIALGQSTKGECIQCGHTDEAVFGCSCPAPYCPCHRGAYGHGAWGCDDRHQWPPQQPVIVDLDDCAREVAAWWCRRG